MITEKFAAKEARRLFALPFPPPTDDGKKVLLDEYAKVLCDSAISESHCKAVVDWLVRHEPRCPPPSTLLMALGQVREPDKAKAPMGCGKCYGSGYVHHSGLGKIPGGGTYMAEFSKPCDCALGRFIQPEYERRRNGRPGITEELR